MTITAATSTFSASLLTMGREITEDDALEVVRMLNQAAAENPALCISIDPERQHNCPNPTTTNTEVYRTKWYIPPHVKLIYCYVEWTIPAASEVTVTVTVGAQSDTIVVNNGSPSDSVEIATADSGTGTVEVAVAIDLTSGAGVCTFDYLLIEAQPVPSADLSAPSG